MEPASKKPTVLLSGALHGDETVGIVSVVEFAELLLHEAVRSVLRRYPVLCDYTTDSFKVSFDGWARNVLATRQILVVPAANAPGFATGKREECTSSGGGSTVCIDVNRDFGFDTDAASCGRSFAARALSALFAAHEIVLAVAFHGTAGRTLSTST